MIQALPPAAGMSNLLLDVAAHTSGCLGVLVEAFPNKEAVLVDHLHALEALVNRCVCAKAVFFRGAHSKLSRYSLCCPGDCCVLAP